MANKTGTRTRKTKSETLVEKANKLVPRAKTLLQSIAVLVKYEPTADQRVQIVETLRADFERLEQAFTTPAETKKTTGFSLS